MSGCSSPYYAPCYPCNPPIPSCVPPPVVVNFGPNPGAFISRLDITSFEGGLSTSLDSVYIEPFKVGALLQIQVGGAPNPVSIVQKVQSTALPVVNLIIRPPDYNAVTNPYQWYVIA